MAFDPYLTNPYFQAQYPAMYQMPAIDPREQQGRAPEFTSIMTGTPQFGFGGGIPGAQGYGKASPGPVVDTTGQFDTFGTRSEERRVGTRGVRTCRLRWSPYNSQNINKL